MNPRTLFFLGLALIVAKGYATDAPPAPTYPNGKSTKLPPPGRLVALLVVFSAASFFPDRIGVPLDLLILAAIVLAPGGIVLPVFEPGFGASGAVGTGGKPSSTVAGILQQAPNTIVAPRTGPGPAGLLAPLPQQSIRSLLG